MLTSAFSLARQWKGRIFYAMLDQGMASTANFLQTILYAAWLPLDDFGRYVVVWTLSVLVETFQIALIMDSLPSIASRFARGSRGRIDKAAAWVVLAYAASTSLLILAAIPIVSRWNAEFALPLVCLALVNPFQRLYILFRRLCYIRDRQDAAAAASVVYALTLLAGAFALHRLGLLTVPAVVLLWGAANGMAVLVGFAKGITCLAPTRRVNIVWLTVRLWQSGRWLVGSAVGYWIANWGMFPLVAAIAGLEATGILRALQNLFTPIIQFNAALNLAILPRVADRIVAAGLSYARLFAIYATAAFTLIVMTYAGLVLLYAEPLLSFIYHKPEILAAAHFLWPLAIAMTLDSARQGSSMALLALGRTRIFFLSRMIGVAIFFGVTAALARFMGMDAVLWANVISHAVGTAIIIPSAFGLGSGTALTPKADRRLRPPKADMTAAPLPALSPATSGPNPS